MKKRAEMSIEFTFLIFLAVIVVMVIVTLILKFAFSGSTMFCKIAGTCNKDPGNVVPDNQVINLTTTPCAAVRTELVKHAKLCYSRALDYATREQTICYSLLSPGGCPFTRQNIEADLSADGINATMTANPVDTKYVVTFMRKTRSISII